MLSRKNMMKKTVIGMMVVALIIIAGLVVVRSFDTSGSSREEYKLEEVDKSDNEAVGYVDVTALEAKKLIDENPDLIIIDVSPKYKEGHIPGAVNYYIGDGTLEKAVSGLDKEATYLVYCHVDSASIPGAQRLIDEGIKNVYRLQGNYAAWVEAGYPVEK